MKIIQRLFGVLTFKADVYSEIIDHSSLWKESAIFIVIAASVNCFFFNGANGFTSQSLARFVAPFISWFLSGYLCALFLKTIYNVSIPETSVMKIVGYAQPFSLVGFHLGRWNLTNPFINLLTSLLGSVLLFLFYFAILIGIRVKSRVSIGKALIVLVLSFLIISIVQFVAAKLIITLF